jgi:hypothetical protein
LKCLLKTQLKSAAKELSSCAARPKFFLVKFFQVRQNFDQPDAHLSLLAFFCTFWWMCRSSFNSDHLCGLWIYSGQKIQVTIKGTQISNFSAISQSLSCSTAACLALNLPVRSAKITEAVAFQVGDQ